MSVDETVVGTVRAYDAHAAAYASSTAAVPGVVRADIEALAALSAVRGGVSG